MATKSKDTSADIEIKDEVKAVEQPEIMNQDVVDIEFKELQRKRFRLDRDNNRVIELNLSDLSVINRIEQIYPRMLKFVEEAQDKITDADDVSGEVLTEINNEMKELLNYAFDSDVADKACPEGTLFDPINGKFRFEYIIERLVNLYDTNFRKEFDLMQRRMDKHTSKYTKKRN